MGKEDLLKAKRELGPVSIVDETQQYKNEGKTTDIRQLLNVGKEDDIYLLDLSGGLRYATVAVRARNEGEALEILADLQDHPEKYVNAMRRFEGEEDEYPLSYFKQSTRPMITKLPHGQKIILAVTGTGED